MKAMRLTKALDINSAYLGIEPIQLMENAGNALASFCFSFDSVAFFCGTGNNGGDGLVAARHLASQGKKVKVFSLKGSRSPENDRNFSVIKNADSIDLRFIYDSSQAAEIKEELKNFECAVDALIGTGIKGELREPVASIINVINSSDCYKIACDLPTKGLQADKVVSFHFSKTQDAKAVSIGIPKEAETQAGPGDVFLATSERRGPEHKGDFGRVLTVGGSSFFHGAPVLSAKAALRSGADLSLIAAPECVSEKTGDPDLIFLPVESDDFLSKDDFDTISDSNFDSMVIGNGLSREDRSAKLVRKLVKNVDKPLILDADALRLIKKRDLKKSPADIILTPHAAEFEFLSGFSPSPENVVDFADDTDTTVILKGKEDMITDGSTLKFNLSGNPGMTVGGTGDVLAGLTGALSCNENAGSLQAASASCFLNGYAADLCLKNKGYNFSASDVLEMLPRAFLDAAAFY